MKIPLSFFIVSVSGLLLLLCPDSLAQYKQPLDTARTEDKTRDVNPFNPDQYHYISWQDNMMGASPEAAKMTRYADTPVSNAYGQAEIGIPIYTIQSRSLSLPITLSYDSSGIKPEEISGIVGLGWSLQAGGVITRTIIGRVDDGDEIPAATTNEADAEGLAYRANNPSYDTEYDRYSYSFCGHSGSFYKIPWVGIVPAEPTELLISGTGPFTITDKDGTQYIFGQTETSSRYMGSNDPNAPPASQTGNYYNLTTAWYLTEIRSMDGKDVITISYQQLDTFINVSHSYYRSISFPYRYLGNNAWQTNLSGGVDPTPTFQTREWSFTTTHEWHPYVVSSITYNGGSVSFGYGVHSGGNRYGNESQRTYPSFLSSIAVNEGGQNAILKWTFELDTTGDYRHLLAAVTQKGQDETTIEKWTFGYDSPNWGMNDCNIDLFGYFNGTGSSSGVGGNKAFLRPFNDESTVHFSVTNRNHNSATVGKLSLKSIKTASGSLTRYNYASNSIPTNGQSNLFPQTIQIGQRISSIETYDLSREGEQLVRRRVFSYANPGITIPIYAFQMGAFISTSENNTCPGGVGTGQWYGSSSPIRTGSIIYNDQSNLPGMPLESARIFYQQVTEDIYEGADPLVRTVWEYNGAGAVSTGGGGTVWAPSDEHDSDTTHTHPPYGPNHFHQRIPTYIPRNGTPSNPTTPLGYHIQDQNRPQLNNPTKVIHYRKDGDQFKKISQTDYTYEGWYDYLQMGLALSMKISPNTNGHENTNVHCLSDVDQQQVDRRIYYQRLTERIDKEFLDDNSVRSVKTTYHYDCIPGGRTSFYSGNTYFSNPIQVPAMGTLQSPRQEVQVYYNDDTKTYIRNIIYPNELIGVSGCSWASSLTARHYMQPVGEEIIIGASSTNKAGRYVTWDQVPVASWANDTIPNTTLLKPSKMEVWRNGQHINRDIRYTLYDSGGRPLEIEGDGQPVKTYAWGYNHRFPIAEVVGKSFTLVRGEMTGLQQSYLDTIASASSLNAGNISLIRTALRTNQPNALTTIHTYSPPFGLATEEDPSGRMLQYTYDYGGRLKEVKDEGGNKLQEYVYNFTNGANGTPNRIEYKTYYSGTSSFRDIAYFDGLGRTLQQVAVAASTSSRDIVTPFAPDFLDREDAREYLPYPAGGGVGSFRPNALNDQQLSYGNGVKAYKENTYELSKRNRIISSSLPGFTEKTTFSTTQSIAPVLVALKLTFNPANKTISADGIYPGGYFKSTLTFGPDGSLTVSYNDEFETPYLEQVRLNSSGSYLGTLASTYYIRDEWGRVVCVVPPAEAAQLTSTTTNYDAKNCYIYTYDDRDRVIRRQLPGRLPEEITYNDADMPTARRRVASDGAALEYFFTTYDSFNRPVKEEYRYDNNTPITLAEYYYDGYQTGFPTFSAESGYASTADTRTQGLKTAERITLLPAGVAPSALTPSNTTTSVQRSYYYDARGNVIQKAETSAFGGVSRTSFSYDLAGNVLKQRQRMAPPSSMGTAVLDRTYTYDARRRLSQVTAKLDNGPQGTLSYAYDSLGRMASISRGTALDNTQYTYTLQGWLETAISTSFEETLRYQNPLFSATDALPGKAGLITEWTILQKGSFATGGTSTHNTYTFSYDKAGRMTNSLRYLELTTPGTVALTERDITYDASGNLLTLKRYGNSSTTPIDSLSYSYDGPKRIGWSYDPNGNVTSDATNGVSIDWNVIDLPRAITSGTSSTQRFYLADGTLSHIQDGTQMRIFLGDIVFKISPGSFGIESAGWEGGRLLPGTGNDKVLYYVNDHLGSVRVVKNGNGFIKQRFDYYPYGSVSRGWWGELGADNPEKRYRFGGKEIAGTASNATATGSDTYLDFGARLYNPRTAFWMSQDPMAEDYYHFTPYLYCAGNPVNVVDPEGLWIWDIQGNLYWQEGDNVFTLADYLQISPLDAYYILDRNSINQPICFSEGYFINCNNIWTESTSQFGVTINNTLQAVLHYYDKTGWPANIGAESTEEAINLINSIHPNILEEGHGSGWIDMTRKTFHIGRTSYSFLVTQKRNTQAISYTLFKNDSFSDPNYWAERLKLPFKRYQPDSKGPNLELGGRPYDYNAKNRTYYKPLPFPNFQQ